MPDKAFDFSLKINGVEIADYIRAHISKIEFEESLTDTAHLDIGIRDCEFFNLKKSDFDLRKPLRMPVEFALGYFGNLEPVFSGDVVKISPSFPDKDASLLTIVCQDVSARLKREPEPTIHDGDNFPNCLTISRHLIKKNALDAVIDPEPLLQNAAGDRFLNQLSHTDWEWLNQIADALHLRLFARGAIVYLVNDDYLLSHQTTKWTFIHGVDRAGLAAPNTAPLLSFKPELSSRGQRLKCEVTAYRAVDAAGIVYQGEKPLADIYHDGKNYTDLAITSEVEEILHIRDKVVKSDKEAKDLAESYLRARADRLVMGQGAIIGNAAIRAGSKHTFNLNSLGDFGKQFSGDYWITGVRHVVTLADGFATSFDVRRDGLTIT